MMTGLNAEQLRRRERFEEPYRRTTYVAFDGAKRAAVRIGEPAQPFGDLLHEGEQEWAYITAWNLASAPTPLAKNEAAQERLRAMLRARGIRFLEGMSEPADGSQGEGSLLAFMPREEAALLGRAFGQNAIVVGRGSETPEILWILPPL